MRTRTFLAVGLLLTLLVAGVASHYASTHPDGLEHVAGQVGFGDRAEEREARVSGGTAGVIGVLLVLGLTGGLTYAVRRRA